MDEVVIIGWGGNIVLEKDNVKKFVILNELITGVIKMTLHFNSF